MRKLNMENVINKFKKIHGNKFDYSLVEYKNMRSKVKIICPIHGVFEQLPSSHINGEGCNKCGIKYKGDNLKLTLIQYIEKSNEKHNNKYDYSLVEYVNSKTKVKIICKEHGVFEQNSNSHLMGIGCPSCKKVKKLTTEDFIKRSKGIHGDKYDYSLVDYKNINKKIKIICFKHGIFEQSPLKHLIGRGCSKCKQSKGENSIRLFLENNNIEYICEKKFENCKDVSFLKFDFYLPNYNICIEYDGIQHFIPVERWGGEKELKNIQKRDKIKTEFCDINNIKLIRINSNENIEEKLNTLLRFNI